MKTFFSTLQNKKVAFIGAGVAHQELIILFAKAGARVTLCDRKSLAEFGGYGDELLNLNVQLSLGENYLDGLSGQDMILRTPGFEFYSPELQTAQKAGIKVTSEIELFCEYCPCRIIAVTGSDGKTTTTSLIAAILEADGCKVHLGGNIGRAMLPIVDSIKDTDVAVVELSSFQLISMQTSPDIAVVTNITPNHLDHHKDMEEYITAKRNILVHQKKGSVAVLGYENKITRSLDKDVVGEVRWFSRLNKVANGACMDSGGRLCLVNHGVMAPVVEAEKVMLRGLHNIENLLAAFAALRDEVQIESMQKVACSFKGVEHRIEPVRILDGVEWYNDSIATSPTRVIAGLRSFNQKLIVIAGGYDKNIPFDPLAKEAVQRIKSIILMGPAADKIEAALRAEPSFSENELHILRVDDMDTAVHTAREIARPGDIVTLSPACASFDAYPNFGARGQHYKELVNEL